MRFDVHLTEHMVERDLADAQARLRQMELLAHDAWRPTPVCDVSILTRITASHRFLYLKDARHDRVVGVFSFESLPPRRTQRDVVLPHGKLKREYRRLGLARWIYRGMLLRGTCMLSSARQSMAAARLWTSLGQEFAHGYVWADVRSAHYLGPQVDAALEVQLPVRRLLHTGAVDPGALFVSARARERRG